MPETPHHSFQIHISLDTDILGSWTNELHEWALNHCLWFAIKHELGDNSKVHIHMIIVYEIQKSTNTGGAKVISRVKSQMRSNCPQLREYLEDNPSRYALVIQTLKSDELIAEYMQKEESLKYFKLPQDLAQLKPYFADMQKDKPKNPEYELWASMYKSDNCEMPATLESVWNFFGHHMYAECDTPIKILSDPKRLKERVMSTMLFINKTAPDFSTIFGGNKRLKVNHSRPNSPRYQTPESQRLRYCPRCPDNRPDKDPEPLGVRKQFCDLCVGYDRAAQFNFDYPYG